MAKRAAMRGALWLALLLMGCSAMPPGPPPQKLRFGAIFSQTGRYAFVGKPGAEVVKVLGLPGVEFVIHDSEGQTSKAEDSLRRLAADPSLLGVIGPCTTDETLAVIRQANDYKLPCLSISAADRSHPTSPWVFRLPITTYHMVYQIGDYLARHDLKRIALISVESGFGKAGRRELLTQAPDFGLTLISDQVSPDRQLKPEETDQLVRASLQSRPQALVIWWSAAGAVELTLAARRQGISIPLLHSGGIAGPEFLQAGGEAANGVLFPGSPLLVPQSLAENHAQKPAIEQFSRFCDQHALPLSNFGGYGWDAANLLVEAARAAGPNRAKIRAYLENLQGWPAVSGVYHFSPVDHNGLTHESFLMIQIEQGRWRPAPE
ncbi:ABC transporter substrate-binding protein [bacterium]|nr:ABC transporter substrate-binding protein [bacterium]